MKLTSADLSGTGLALVGPSSRVSVQRDEPFGHTKALVCQFEFDRPSTPATRVQIHRRRPMERRKFLELLGSDAAQQPIIWLPFESQVADHIQGAARPMAILQSAERITTDTAAAIYNRHKVEGSKGANSPRHRGLPGDLHDSRHRWERNRPVGSGSRPEDNRTSQGHVLLPWHDHPGPLGAAGSFVL